jgi:oligopeptide/dipeptide ABC transporter ATP-binding protein
VAASVAETAGTTETADSKSTGPDDAVIVVEHLTVAFPGKDGSGEVVRDVSFTIRPGERVGLVGESGSGKSLTARAMMRLIPQPGRMTEGKIRVLGAELPPGKKATSWRGTVVAMITQDPLSSLNPLVRIGAQMTEMLRFHRGMSRSAARARAAKLLAAVGIPDPARALTRFPAVLSGGMRQRVALAIAISCEPRLLIADEPTTALDVTIQAQVLEVLERMTAEQGSAVLLISHDLGVVATFCDRLLVMYGGRIVESGSTSQIVTNPAHPYTRALMASVPSMTGELPDRLAAIGGSPPTGGTWPPGCTFAPRCPIARQICSQADPELAVLEARTALKAAGVANVASDAGTDIGTEPHLAACHASHDESWGRAG